MNNAPSRYVIDTSAIIAMYREWYPRRVLTSLWGDIETLARTNQLITVSKVVDELNPEHDEPFQDADQAVNNRILFNWISERLPTSRAYTLDCKWPSRSEVLKFPFLTATGRTIENQPIPT